jgi:hypothetical protein
LRRLAVLAVLAGITASLPVPLAGATEAGPPGVARPNPATMALASQPSWVPPDGTAVLGLTFKGPVEGMELRVTAHRALTSRSAFNRTLTGDGLGAPEGKLAASVVTLEPDAGGNRHLAIGIQGPASAPDPFRIVPGKTGVYPIEVELWRQGQYLDRFITPLVVVAPGLVPLTLAWVWRFDATPARLPGDGLRSAAAKAVGPAGRLVRMAEAMAGAPDLNLTLAPTPETIEAWAHQLSRDDRLPSGVTSADLAAGLARLREAVAGPNRQLLSAPYVPLDMPSLLSADLGGEVDRQYERGAKALSEILGVAPTQSTQLAGPLDSASVGRLHQYGVERVVVAPRTVEPLAQRLTPGRPFSLAVRGRPPVQGALSDPDLAGLLEGDGPPALQAARFLAALSLVALEAPGERRGVVVVTPSGWDPPTALLEAVLGGLRGHPAVEPATLDGFFSTVPPETTTGTPLARKPADRAVPDPDVDAAAVRSNRRRLSAFSQVVGDGQLSTAADRALLTSLASAPDDEGRDALRGRTAPRAYLSAAGHLMEDVTGRVRGPNGQRVTLTARRARLPISLLNANSQPLQVRVRLESDQLRFPEGSERMLTLPPQNTTESFAVETRAPGAFPLVITVTSPDGQLVVNRSKLTIRSTVVSGVGATLTAGAGLFLLVWWGNDLRRSRRQRQRQRARPQPAPPRQDVDVDVTEPGLECPEKLGTQTG